MRLKKLMDTKAALNSPSKVIVEYDNNPFVVRSFNTDIAYRAFGGKKVIGWDMLSDDKLHVILRSKQP